MQKSRIYVFTASFPYGIREHWKLYEIMALAEKFHEVKVIPFSYFGQLQEQNWMPPNVTVAEPLFRTPVYIKPGIIRHLLSKRISGYLSDFFRGKVFSSKKRIISWLDAICRVESLSRHPETRELFSGKEEKNVILYFYWGVGSAFIIPFLSRFEQILVRFHGFDLYEERNAGYIPFRKKMLNKVTHPIFISEQGRKYEEEKYPEIISKSSIFRLGVRYEGDAIPSSDGILRILSCSSVIPLKRVDLIFRALCQLNIPIEWTHVGGGPLLAELMENCSRVRDKLKCNLVGQVSSQEVRQYYVNQRVDLFINVSTTEGVPVSIMEALSASIPIIATNVGGTSEIVDSSVGFLIPDETAGMELVKNIEVFYRLPFEEKLKLRRNAKIRFEEMCDSDRLNRTFIEFVSNL